MSIEWSMEGLPSLCRGILIWTVLICIHPLLALGVFILLVKINVR